MKRSVLVATLGGTVWLAAAFASSPTAWEMNSSRDFVAGRLTGLSLTRDGRLTLAPKTETLLASDEPVVWSVVAAPDGTLYAGTGHRGRVYRIDPSGKSTLLWTSGQPEIFALALDPKGGLYAATSPNGAVYRIDEHGKATEYFNPKAKYIWSLEFAPDGVLYAGTGEQGLIYRVEPGGAGQVYYQTGQTHVTCLAVDNQGRLLAGSEPNGLIYRVTAKDKAFVLYDAALPEIRSLVAAPDGSVYAAALGGSINRAVPAAQPAGQTGGAGVSAGSASATVTVEASADDNGIDIKPKPDATRPQAPQTGGAAITTAAPMQEIPGADKSAIYRIFPDNTVENLFTSKEENIYDLLVSGSHLVFSTDGQGRIYRLTADRKLTLITQTNEGEATRLLETAKGVVAATGDMGKVYRLEGVSASGTYESPVHDASTVARWGRLSWRGEMPERSGMVFRTRTGNSLRPDATWSDWSDPISNPDGSAVKSPNARYIQWKAEFTGAASARPVLDSVTVAYLPQNTAPVVKAISVTAQLSAAAGAAKAAQQAQSGGAYTVTVSDTPDTGSATSAGTPTQQVPRSGSEQLQISWQAEDADGDRMTYALSFRGEDEHDWKQLKANLTDANYTLDSDSLADGKYYFRVVASDAPSNSPATARTAELVSAPTLIDHTPPVVVPGPPKHVDSHVEINIEASDAASPLRRCEYSVDAGPWVEMDPVEGILDSRRERFLVKLENLPAGEHLVVIRAMDSANNAGLAKVLVH